MRRYRLSSWWLAAFILAVFGIYEQAAQKTEKEILLLKGKLTYTERQLESAIKLRADLQDEVESQSDPVWIELVLMKRLGLVPEGYTKIYFKEAE